MRRGLFGGTFDPIHRGHLDVAEAARQALGIDRVSFVPARVPPHRSAPRASAPHRFAMVALALEARPAFTVSDVEMLSDAASYTSATLDRLAESGVNIRACFFIVGADAFRDIATWRDYPAFLDRCTFVVVSRPTQPAPALRAALPDLSARMIDAPCDVPAGPSIVLVDAPTAPVSSTDIRRRVAEGSSISDLVPAAVAEYIDKHGLYAQTA